MPRKAKGVENEIKTNQEPETNVNLSVSSSKKTSKTSSSVDKKTSTSKKGATKSTDTKSKATKKTTTTKKTATEKSTTSKKSSLESKKDTTAVKATKSSSKKAETSTTSNDKTKATSSKKADTKATSTRKTVSKAKKEVSSSERATKAPTKKTTAKKATAKSAKTTTAKEKSAAKATKATTAKEKKETSSSGRAMLAPTKKAPAKKTPAKKAPAKKAATKSTAKTKSKKGTVVSSLTGIPTNGAPTIDNKETKAKKSVTAKKAKAEEILEYYDLPYRYNETTVKILAQTPKKLFIYWDISDNDRKNYVEKFGNEFFNNTVPVLIVHNASQNYTFEVEINDFANCWYLDINDAKCEYNIELGRRSKNQHFSIPNNYIYVTSSNVIESPNDHILFEKQTKTVYFRNVKTNATHSKDIANISFIRNMGKIYNIYDAYKKLYNKMYSDEDIIDINNPSSANPTSTFK